MPDPAVLLSCHLALWEQERNQNPTGSRVLEGGRMRGHRSV